MRIVTELLEISRLGGIEVNALEDVRELVRRGHDVHVLHGPDTYGHGDLRTDLVSAGATLHGPIHLTWSPLLTPFDLTRYLPGRRVIGRLAPDVLWLQRFEHLMWAKVATAGRDIPIACHLHHAPNYRPAAQRVLADGTERFLAVSDFTRTQWVDRGLRPDRVEVLRNAVRPTDYPWGGPHEYLASRESLDLPNAAPIILYYGRLTKEKGVDVVLDAFEHALRSGASAHLLVAGAAPPFPEALALEKRLATLVAAGHATALPPQRDVVPLLHAADVVLFPSREPEAFGRVALEALMAGRPVVATRLGGVLEVIPHELEYLMVPPGDAEALSATSLRLLRWREDQPDLGASCRSLAMRRFDLASRFDELERLLGVVARTGRRSRYRRSGAAIGAPSPQSSPLPDRREVDHSAS